MSKSKEENPKPSNLSDKQRFHKARFLSYLKHNNLTEAYFRNLKLYPFKKPGNTEERWGVEILDEIRPVRFLLSGFDWASTDEGDSFWNNHCTVWSERCVAYGEKEAWKK